MPATTPRRAAVATPKKPVAVTPKKSAKKPAKGLVKSPKHGHLHPSYAEMAAEAILHSKEKGGSTRATIKKYILSHFQVEDTVSTNGKINKALKRGVEGGVLSTAKKHAGHFLLKAAADPKPGKKTPKKATPKVTPGKATPKKVKKPAVKKALKKVPAKVKKPAAKVKKPAVKKIAKK